MYAEALGYTFRRSMEYTSAITAAIDFIEAHLFESLSPAEVATHIGFSEYHFHRIFQGMLGESVSVYIRNRRLSEAAIHLRNSNKTILEIAVESGFENHESFFRAFKKIFGASPSHYRKCATKTISYQKMRTTKTMIEHLQTGINLEPKFEIKGPDLVVGMAGGFSPGRRTRARSTNFQRPSITSGEPGFPRTSRIIIMEAVLTSSFTIPDSILRHDPVSSTFTSPCKPFSTIEPHAWTTTS